MSSSSPINEIKEKADIVELISDHIPVKRSGAGYIAKCPFHNDTKPSMHISSQKGIFKCFACGAGGDVFKFWAEYHNKDFAETLKDLALRYGVTLKQYPENIAKQKNQSLYLEIYKLTAEYYHEKLLASENAENCRKYLSARGIDLNTIKAFKLGYSPINADDWGLLLKYLSQKLKVSEKEILDAGLAIQHEKTGKFYDRFRERLMIPITNEKDEVIAFGARLLEDIADSPKYINSPETEIYHKGDELFGLALAKKAIKEEDSVILVEGYFDQIAVYRSGMKNVVANQGTALTPKQAKLLMKYSLSKNIYLCLDSDKAGEAAKERAFEVIMQNAAGLNPAIKVIELETAKDPDEFIEKFGIDTFRQKLGCAKFFIDYKADKFLEEFKKTEFGPREKALFIRKLARFMFFINNKIELNAYLHKLASQIDLDTSIVEEQLKSEFQILSKELSTLSPVLKNHKPKIPETQSASKKIQPSNIDMLARFDIELLAIMLEDIRLLEEFMAAEYRLNKKEHDLVLAALVDVSFENPEENTEFKFNKLRMHEALEDLTYANILAEIGMELETDKKQFLTRFNEIIKRNERYKLESLKRKLEAELKIEEKNKNHSEADRLFKEITMLTKELEK